MHVIRNPAAFAGALILSCLPAPPVAAQTLFEDGELAGWSTEGTIQGVEVSGGREPAGGAPGAHYLVRHLHRNGDPFAPSVVSISLSGQEVPAAALAGGVRFEADLRFEVDPGFLPALPPVLIWQAALEQAGVALTVDRLAEVRFRDQYLSVAMTGIQAGEWGGLDLSPGAPPVRFGLTLQSTVLAAPGNPVEARIRVDDVRVIAGSGPRRVSLVALPSPEGDPVVFAPVTCFDGQPDPVSRVFDVYAELDRTLAEEVCIDIGGPALDPDAPAQPCAAVPAGERYGAMELRCRAQPPSTVALGPSLPAGVVAGAPASAEVRPCELLVAGTLQPCETVTDLCAVEAFLGQLCQAGHIDLCDPPLPPARAAHARSAAPPRPRRAAPGSAAGGPLATLRDLRDGPMSESPAGRYYRDLYDGFSPELRSLLLSDLRIPLELLEVYPPWVDALGALVAGDGNQATMTPAMIGGLLRVLDRFEQAGGASAPLRAAIARERQRLDLGDLAGQPIDALVARLEERGGPPQCATSDTALCLEDGRFLVEAHWTDFQGGSGAGRAVPLPSGGGAPDSGYFWFFDEANVELVVKVLDGRPINDRFWVFYGALSNVAYTLRVTDTETGAVRLYRNPSGHLASVGDTGAFTPDGAAPGVAGAGVARAAAAGRAAEPSLLERLATGVAETLGGAWRRLTEAGSPARSPAPLATAAAGGLDSASLGGGTCTAGPTALCLRDGRFRVEVEWQDFQGGSGPGRARPLTGDTGTFWFFNPANTELIVKVLDGRPVNGHFWVFYGALSNVAYTVRVTDTATGELRTYENPAREFGSRADTAAF